MKSASVPQMRHDEQLVSYRVCGNCSSQVTLPYTMRPDAYIISIPIPKSLCDPGGLANACCISEMDARKTSKGVMLYCTRHINSTLQPHHAIDEHIFAMLRALKKCP